MLLLILAAVLVPVILAGLTFETLHDPSYRGSQVRFTPTYRAYGA